MRAAAIVLLLLGAFASSLPRAALAAAPSDSVIVSPSPTAAAPALTTPRVGGYFQAREVGQEHVGLTAFLNRARLSVDGTLPARFAYRALLEMQASAGARVPATVSLREAIIRWNPAPFALTAGEFKTPFTREYLIPVPALELADLAVVVDSLAPKYDVGFMAEYALGSVATFQAGTFNGEGANAIANRDSTVLLVGRVTTRPIPQLGLGASYTRDGADSLRWGADAVVQQYGLGVRAEYVTRHVRGRDTSKDDYGWYVFEAARLTPRIQLVARQEDFQRPWYGASRRVRAAAYGSNFEIAPNRVRLLLEYSRRMTGALQAHSDAVIAQLQAQF